MMFSPDVNLDEFIKQMTLEEKASFCSGNSFWYTNNLDRLKIPSINMTDGPHGLRKADESTGNVTFGKNMVATCFPPACCSASSWDPEVTSKIGVGMAEECIGAGCSIILGPGCNIKRSPLCGRNFEYFSEDPVLSSQMAKGIIQGCQSKNVGTSLKHFFANNQETNRFSASSNLDERTAREIYLRSFEDAVKEAQPWTVMCCYNKVNDIFGSENDHSLREVLKDEWGFQGFVVSDWGASNFRPNGVRAGMDLQMPGPDVYSNQKVVEYVKNGKLEEKWLDDTVKRILRIVQKGMVNKVQPFSFEKHHQLAREVAAESMVLLKNDGTLPLCPKQKVAFIGPYAKEPRYQGSGSSFINTWRVTSPLEAVKEEGYDVEYAQGCDGHEDVSCPQLLSEAVTLARRVGTAVLFVGLPELFESESFDRKHMNLPDCQLKLIEEVSKVAKTVVVLQNGSPVVMPFVNDVNSILESYLAGQNTGGAVVDLLFGKVNPSGKLPETFPLVMEQNPSYANFAQTEDVQYSEGIFVGYRYYQKHKVPVLFPFGHGLSYTTFEYTGLRFNKTSMKDNEKLEVTLTVKNTGSVAGKEVVQLYVSDLECSIPRPVRELKKFQKVLLLPGESKEVKFELSFRDFAFWHPKIDRWYVETGDFAVQVGSSSEDIRLSQNLKVEGTYQIPFVVDSNTLMEKLFDNPKTSKLAFEIGAEFLKAFGDPMEGLGPAMGGNIRQMTGVMPLRSIPGFAHHLGGVDELVNKFNALLKN